MPNTPGPCGCRIVWVEDDPNPNRHRIIYCPTHEAAFENEAELRRLRKRVKELEASAASPTGSRYAP